MSVTVNKCQQNSGHYRTLVYSAVSSASRHEVEQGFLNNISSGPKKTLSVCFMGPDQRTLSEHPNRLNENHHPSITINSDVLSLKVLSSRNTVHTGMHSYSRLWCRNHCVFGQTNISSCPKRPPQEREEEISRPFSIRQQCCGITLMFEVSGVFQIHVRLNSPTDLTFKQHIVLLPPRALISINILFRL